MPNIKLRLFSLVPIVLYVFITNYCKILLNYYLFAQLYSRKLVFSKAFPKHACIVCCGKLL